MPDEKDLRGIRVGDRDLLECLTQKESEDYHREEGKGKPVYHKTRVKYKLTTEPNGKVRKWTQKEIEMYEQLKKYDNLTEITLMLLKLEPSVSAKSAHELLKDHPMKPGTRGVTQALYRIYLKLEPVLNKFQKGRQVFYQFKSADYAKVSLENLLAVYRRKKPIESIMGDPVPSTKTLLEYVKEFEPRIKKLEDSEAALNNRVVMLEEYSLDMSKRIDMLLNKETSGQRIDVHHYLHLGKED